MKELGGDDERQRKQLLYHHSLSVVLKQEVTEDVFSQEIIPATESQCFFFFLFFLGLHLQHMEVPRPEVELELQQLLAYTTATAMSYFSHICDLHHSLQATANLSDPE